ncbi:SREBP regulating gene protein-like isoform X2 [Branchiostoma floridae x Branchiostoma japonicum]
MISRRIFRRRWFLALVLGASLLYFLVSVFKQSEQSVVKDTGDYKPPEFDFRRKISWKPRFQARNLANKTDTNCRNSVQGKEVIADERGFVCDREDILVGGCCDVTSLTTRRFTCASCQENGCCQVYEHCVSCCLQPEKQPLLRSLLDHVPDAFKTLFASVTDHFELCLAKCRTSSQSVQHENSYRDPKAKFCYGADPPHLQPGR